jgi:prophage antirepressor-like protein
VISSFSKSETRQCANTSRASIENNRVGNIDMNIVAKSEFNFQGNAIVPVANLSGIWLTSTDIANALQYKSSKSITNLFNQNSDEFTSGMTQVIESVTSGNYRKKVRVFNLRGAHLIAMFARTDVAKEFRRWVLDILDREVAHSPIAKQFSDEELQDLCWLWRASVGMASKMDDVEPLLRVAEHRLAGAYHSMPREYSRVMNKARKVLERETMHIHADRHTTDNWRVLNNLRILELH